MSYLVLARKWRPKSFAEMVGQGHVLQALTNALNQERLHHAYLFTGTRGVGKTTVARIFAKALNCEKGISSTPCGVCSACTEIDQGRFVDLIEVDAASRTGVDDTRDLLENVAYAPVRGRFKIYLIDEVHMFSKSSFNALLKTLEEPPEHVKFLLATTDPQKLPVTVLSRCLQFNLRALPHTQIQSHLVDIAHRENLPGDAAAMALIAEAAQGSMRDALSLLDQAIAYSSGGLEESVVGQMLGLSDQTMIIDLLAALAGNQAERVFSLIDEALGRGVEPNTFLDQLLEKIHHLALAQWLPEKSAVVLPDALRALDPPLLQLWYQIAGTGRRDMAWAPNPRMGLEMTLLRMLAFTQMPSERTPGGSPPTTGFSPPPPVATGQNLPGPNSPVSERAPGKTVAQAPVQPTRIAEPEMPQRDSAVSASRSANDNLSAPSTESENHVSSAPLLTAITAESWHELAARISQPARALAERCHVQMNGDQIILNVAPGFSVMASAKARASLLKQLSTMVDVSRVRIEVDAALPVENSGTSGQGPAPLPQTPAERRSHNDRQDQQARLESIEAHPAVRVLTERARAEVVLDSVQPIRTAEGS